MKQVVVGVADCQVTKDRQTTLITYALGSCIAVLVHDPIERIGGLLHFLLPAAALDPHKARQNPYMFADTGISALLQSVYELGASKKSLKVAAVGGARFMDKQNTFNVGRKNHQALREVLKRCGVCPDIEEIGGSISRTVRLEIETGSILLKANEEREQLLNWPRRWGAAR